jgi:hypothetical protein
MGISHPAKQHVVANCHVSEYAIALFDKFWTVINTAHILDEEIEHVSSLEV